MRGQKMLELNGPSVLAVLKQEAAACQELAALREEQRRLIDAGEAEQLLGVLARKEQAIARITRFEGQLKPVKAEWETRKGRFAARERVAITDAFREVRNLLELLIARETEDAEVLAARKEAAQQELDTFDRKRQLEMAYRRSSTPVESRYVDRSDT
jgi:hypothetical protein